jgi:hypothetical protein
MTIWTTADQGDIRLLAHLMPHTHNNPPDPTWMTMMTNSTPCEADESYHCVIHSTAY